MDKENIKYGNNYFDVVFISHVLEHISDEIRFLKEINRVLKSKGKLYIEILAPETLDFPSRNLFLEQGINTSNFFDDTTHIKTYGMENLMQLIKSTGFIIIEYGVIENKLMEDSLFAYGIKENDQEMTTYAIWSKLRWAHYIIGEKV